MKRTYRFVRASGTVRVESDDRVLAIPVFVGLMAAPGHRVAARGPNR